MEILIPLAAFLVPLIVFGVIIGRTVEKRHFRNLNEREEANRSVLVTQLKSFPLADPSGAEPTLVLSEVVIGSDYLKSFFSQWRNLFGGEIKSFTTLQERGKREAVLRLIEQTTQLGYNAICNVRVDSADIGGNTSGEKNKIPMAAVIASGTAYQARVYEP